VDPWFKQLPARAQARAVSFARVVRAWQWWDYKLVPIFSIFYATAYTQQISIAMIWPAAVALLLALAPCAAYVSLINDVTDRADDQRAGKANRMADRPVWQMALLLAAPLCVAAVFAILWRDDLPLVVAYLGAWGAFTLYSVPPFRWKRRGILGVVADASGAHLFPALVAALLAYRAAGRPPDWLWLGAVAVWAFGCGLRGIIWHQLYDLGSDQKAAVETFVRRHSRRAAVRLAAYGALPIELAALVALLWRMHSPWPVVLLLFYAAFAALKSRAWGIAVVIAEPRERYAILGTEYYTLLFPLGILLSSTLQYPADAAVLIAHLIVFPQPAISFIRETAGLARDSLGGRGSQRGVQRTMRHEGPQTRAVCSNSHRRDEGTMTAPANTSAPTLDVAVTKAAAFLRERLRSGSYGLAAIGSDGTPRFPNDKGHVFVAWPIAEAMTGLLDEIDRTIILVRIMSEEQEGVWGYQSPGMLYTDETRPFLVDSDDSAYAIRTLHRLGVNREPRGLMRFYREPERLFVTWDTPGPTSLATDNSLQNNFRAHPEVNANIFLALRGTHFEKFVNYDMLLQAQDERGFWKSYFYPSPLYATLLVLDLTRGNPAFAAATERALSFIVGSQNADGSWGAEGDPYETALAVAAFAGHPAHAATTRRGVEHLLSTMAGDGSWMSGACVWEAYWNEHDIWRGYDSHRAFVSARCMIALRRAAGQLAPP
jgi:1,4-dihydroxy-2-naphthoate octaprenyltransferase